MHQQVFIIRKRPMGANTIRVYQPDPTGQSYVNSFTLRLLCPTIPGCETICLESLPLYTKPATFPMPK